MLEASARRRIGKRSGACKAKANSARSESRKPFGPYGAGKNSHAAGYRGEGRIADRGAPASRRTSALEGVGGVSTRFGMSGLSPCDCSSVIGRAGRAVRREGILSPRHLPAQQDGWQEATAPRARRSALRSLRRGSGSPSCRECLEECDRRDNNRERCP